MNSTRIGSEVTAQAMPIPSTNCQFWPLAPTQPLLEDSMIMAAAQPRTRGLASASPAVSPVSLRSFQADFRSSSTPAIQTKIITPHWAIPFSEAMVCDVKMKW